MATKPSAPNDQDLRNIVASIQQDLQLQVKLTVEPAGPDVFLITATVYREVSGVKLGIYKVEVLQSPRGRCLLAETIAACMQAYWGASDLAHSGARPKWAPKKGERP